ncbi:MAG: histidinol-phosphate transaminase [Haliea sp.]|nr:MAG: histidinol-phosphate transaminase [Haliea sp.]
MDGRTFWSPALRDLEPYVPGEQPRIANLVKLNTNENPYPPSVRVVAAITAAAQQGLQLYPDSESGALRDCLADHHGLEPEQVFPGNGSDEVLAHAFFAFFRQAQPLLMPDVSYSFYRVYCQLYGIAAQPVPVDAALRLQVADYAGRAAGGVVIANPNAPTGIALPLAAVEQLLRDHPQCVVLVDEAYVDFGGESAIALVPRYPNLLVVHTLSKSRSLAGLRVGFAAGQRHLIDALERVKNSFNSYPLDRLAVAGAVAAYEDMAWFEQTRQAVMQSRDALTLALWRLGFDVLPSAANFVFARHPAHDAAQLAQQLRAQHVLVRHFREERVAQYLRISVGTTAQCEALVQALQRLMTSSGDQ